MAGPRGGTGSPAGMGGGPGPRDPAWSSGQAQTCAQLLTQVAPECSVPKEPFVLSCQADMAECAPQGRRDCACASLSEYSRRCSMAGQPVSHWRRPGLCCESWGRQRGGPGTLPGSWKETGEGAGQGAGAPPPRPGPCLRAPVCLQPWARARPTRCTRSAARPAPGPAPTHSTPALASAPSAASVLKVRATAAPGPLGTHLETEGRPRPNSSTSRPGPTHPRGGKALQQGRDGWPWKAWDLTQLGAACGSGHSGSGA